MRSLLLLLLVPAACRSGPLDPPDSGEMAVEWVGTSRGILRAPATAQWCASDRGILRAPATAQWCASDTLLELFAVRNDTAVGFTLLPKDSLAPGGYSVLSTQVFISLRPQANVAVRWLDQTELKGFEGASGAVTVSEAGAGWVSGSLEASLRRAGNPDSIRLSGRFSRIPIAPANFRCGRANRPGAG